MLAKIFLIYLVLSVVGFSVSQAWWSRYKIDRSQTTGWYHWECKDGSGEGWAVSRRAARRAGRSGCK